MRDNPLLYASFLTAAGSMLYREREREMRKLQGLDLEHEYRKVKGRTSGLSRSMRELVVKVYEREQERTAPVCSSCDQLIEGEVYPGNVCFKCWEKYFLEKARGEIG